MYIINIISFHNHVPPKNLSNTVSGRKSRSTDVFFDNKIIINTCQAFVHVHWYAHICICTLFMIIFYQQVYHHFKNLCLTVHTLPITSRVILPNSSTIFTSVLPSESESILFRNESQLALKASARFIRYFL